MTEPEKYVHILALAKSQIVALQRKDFAQFQRILTAKGSLISSLRNGRNTIAQDPDLAQIAKEIHDADKQSEQLLSGHLDAVGDKLKRVRLSKPARNAYANSAKVLPSFIPTRETPRLFDQRL